MTPLSLSPWIDHFAFTAVEGGFVTALALVCLIQYLWHMSVVSRFRTNTQTLQEQLVELAGIVAQAQHVRAERELENHLLRDFLSEADAEVALRNLLQRFVPAGAAGFSALYLAEPQWSLRQAVGLSSEEGAGLEPDPRLLARLQSTQTVVLTGSEAEEWGLLRQLAPPERGRVDRLFVIRTSCPGEELDGLLVTTALPDCPGRPDGQQGFAERVLAAIGPHLRRTVTHSAQELELRVTREILELRSIVDAEFRSPQELAGQFLQRLTAVTEFQQASVHLLRPRESRLSCLVRHAADDVGALAEWAAADDALVFETSGLTQLQQHSVESLRDAIGGAPFAQAITVPMQIQGTTLGVLSLARETPRPLGSSERELIAWAADYLFDTILKTADRALTEDRARRDALTGLANRHTFDTSLEEHLRRAFRSGRECSLVLFDIDHFKSVNDTHGHLAGDEALRTVAAIIRDNITHNLRGSDRPLAARYGGEELAVIMPGVGQAGAFRVAEEIRQQVARTRIVHEECRFQVTLSGGVAVAQTSTESMRSLIAAADQALYAAKQQGRNCIVAESTGRGQRPRSAALTETAAAGVS